VAFKGPYMADRSLYGCEGSLKRRAVPLRGFLRSGNKNVEIFPAFKDNLLQRDYTVSTKKLKHKLKNIHLI